VVIKIYGDSHSKFFTREQTLARVFGFKAFYDSCNVNVFHGASVKGFKKTHSTLNLKAKILMDINSDDIIVLAFGQVDVESGFLYKTLVKDSTITYQDFISECLDSYLELINSVMSKCSNLIVKGINYPVVIEKGKAARVYQGVVKEAATSESDLSKLEKSWIKKFPDLAERVYYARYFNEQLKKRLLNSDAQYFDINDEIADAEGVVYPEFIPVALDHHLAETLKTRQVYISKLEKVINAL
jgi:hypothetical protein